MQRALIDAIQKSRGNANPAGFLFMTDDVLLNLGQLTHAVNTSGCGVIWRSDNELCEDILARGKHRRMIGLFLSEARSFFEVSEEGFKEQLARNLGSESTYCMAIQNDFLYIPSEMAKAWAKVAQQMTDSGLVFTFAYYTAIYGIAPMKDMVVLRTRYLNRGSRAEHLLKG